MSGFFKNTSDQHQRPKWLPTTFIVLISVASLGVLLYQRNGYRSVQSDGISKTPMTSNLPLENAVNIRTSAHAPTGSVAKFILVAASQNEQFTKAQLQTLANNYDLIYITKAHGFWNRTRHNEAARRLKQLNPNLKVYFYLSTSYRMDRDYYGADTFKEEWLLHNRQSGQPIRAESDDAYYVDLSDPEYRKWVLGLIAEWMRQAPYDGVFWDNATPLGLGDEENWRKDWAKLIGREKIEAWNNGLKALLAETKQLVGPNRQVIYNGFDRKPWRVNRNLDLLKIADGALNEGFCYKRDSGLRTKQEMLEDIEIQITYGTQHKLIYQKTNFYRRILSGAERDEVSRFCFGSFLLGYQPGYTFFKFGPGYSTELGEIEINALEINLNFGEPEAPYQQEGTVFKRKFANGWIFVNMEQTPSVITIPEPLILMNGGKQGPSFQAGQRIDVPAHDAVFLLKP